MFRTLAKAIAAGATTLIVTTRVDVAGCGYVWFGIRKGHTELDGHTEVERVARRDFHRGFSPTLPVDEKSGTEGHQCDEGDGQCELQREMPVDHPGLQQDTWVQHGRGRNDAYRSDPMGSIGMLP